jgi:CRISPR type I-E-associated protein CasB/Cse2
MSLSEAKPRELPDFAALWQRFEQLDNGSRSALRRLGHLDDAGDTPAFYRWRPPGIAGHEEALQRIAFLLPHVRHQAGAASLGSQLHRHKVSEMRLFQVLRADSPRDIEALRRLLQQMDSAVDWNDFGTTLWYWNALAKRRLLQDFFVPTQP